MNELISTFFGDSYITLECESGECLHYSQVPGYVVSSSLCLLLSVALRNFSFKQPPKPDNTAFIALSIAGAGLLVVGVSASKRVDFHICYAP